MRKSWLFLTAIAAAAPARAEPPDPPAPGAPAAPTAPLPEPPATVAAPPPAPAKVDPPKVEVSTYGRVQLIVGIDPQNNGDVPDVNVAPATAPREWTASIQTNAALGGRFRYHRPVAGFVVSGQVQTALYVRRIFAVTTAGVTLDNSELGLKIGVGRFVQPTVNTLTPSVFQFSSNWGNLIHETSGAYVAKKHDRLTFQLGVGRPDFVLFTEPIAPVPRSAPKVPFVEGRIAYIDSSRTGELPSTAVIGPRTAPLTLAVSGAFGKQRVGVGEKTAVAAIAADAVDPIIEDVASWLVSVEAVIPLGKLTLAGEWYVGRGANAYIGAVRQRPHVDLATGRHTALSSRGGWGQLSYHLPGEWTAIAVGGLEHVTSGLRSGVSVEGPSITENRLIGASLSKTLGAFHTGIQIQHQETHYLDAPDSRMFAVLLEGSVDF